MAYRIQITRPARRDAQEFAAFVRDRQQSPATARRWLDGPHAAIQTLTETPHRYAVIPEAEDLGFPYRSLLYHSHRIIYAGDDSEQRVIIHLIYHGARKQLAGTDIT